MLLCGAVCVSLAVNRSYASADQLCNRQAEQPLICVLSKGGAWWVGGALRVWGRVGQVWVQLHRRHIRDWGSLLQGVA